MAMRLKGRVLIIAGSDSGGGAGIQADLKTVTALGGYATTAITALTAQDTNAVHGVMPVSDAFIEQQIRVVLKDIGSDAIKTGMLPNAGVIRLVTRLLREMAPQAPIIVDPVMVAKGGDRLMDLEAVAELKRSLLLDAYLVTPNIPEAEILSGMAIHNVADMKHAAMVLRTMGTAQVLIKGGHLRGDQIHDVLATDEGVTEFISGRIISPHTHGTGCTLASAIATLLAQGVPLSSAVEQARHYVREAIIHAPGLGQGHGPLNHAWPLSRSTGY